LMDFILTLESALGVKAKLELHPMAPGDVAATYADTSRLAGCTHFQPSVGLKEGVAQFVAWYRAYYRV